LTALEFAALQAHGSPFVRLTMTAHHVSIAILSLSKDVKSGLQKTS